MLLVTQASTCGGSIKDFLEEWGGKTDSLFSICWELQAETQHTSLIKSKYYVGLGKHSLGFLSYSSARSVWNYFITKLQSRLQKHSCAHAQLMYESLYCVWLICIMCLSTLLLGLNQATPVEPSLNPTSTLQPHLKLGVARLGETAPHLPRVSGWNMGHFECGVSANGYLVYWDKYNLWWGPTILNLVGD